MDPLIEIKAADVDEVDGMAVDAMVPATWIDAALSAAGLAVGVGDWEARSDPSGGHVTAQTETIWL